MCSDFFPQLLDDKAATLPKNIRFSLADLEDGTLKKKKNKKPSRSTSSILGMCVFVCLVVWQCQATHVCVMLQHHVIETRLVKTEIHFPKSKPKLCVLTSYLSSLIRDNNVPTPSINLFTTPLISTTGDTNVSCKSLQPNSCEGWLLKLGGSGLTPKNWRKRWFVLKGFCLYYFKSDQDEQALGVITMPSFNIAAAHEVR